MKQDSGPISVKSPTWNETKSMDRGRNNGSPVVRGYQKLGRTTKDDDSSSLKDYHTIWEYFSSFVFVVLFCLNLGHITTTYI